MRVALFVPCYVDQLRPRTAWATLELLERLGVAVDFPEAQTCCGQPLLNAGAAEAARPAAAHFARVFAGYDYVVAPSGSCVAMVRHHSDALLPDDAEARALRARTFELCEFLVDVLGVTAVEAEFPHRVALHVGCHALRELRLASAGERVEAGFDKVRSLLASVRGLTLVEPERPGECCGFGGSFAWSEAAVSAVSGSDRVADYARAGAECLVSTDVSCLLHLDGIARREGRGLGALHVSEVLVAGS